MKASPADKQQPDVTDAELLEVVRTLLGELHPNLPPPGRIALDSTFEEELGLDSLSRVELIARIEAAFGLSLPDRTFAQAQTPRDLLRVLQRLKPVPADREAVPAAAPASQEAAGLPDDAETLLDVLEWHAAQHGERLHIQLYQDDGRGETITYARLREGAEAVAASLQENGLKTAEPVAIMLPTGSDYFFTFFGILMAGGIPVPIYPPARPSQLEEHMRRHAGIIENCRARFLVTLPEGRRAARLLMSLAPAMERILTAAELRSGGEHAALPRLRTHDIAFLQYTSGSTGSPKGVILTHANLLANIRAMGSVVRAGPDDVFVSWLPLYHDMGLIGAWLGSLYYAARFVVMSPLSFLARPERWLRAIERHRGTLSAAPNFGYEYTLHRLKDVDLGTLDLSSWRAAFNGAEAVNAATLRQFTARFAPHGFAEKAMMPVYGLAESSVGLAFPPLFRGARVDRIDGDTFMRSQKAVPSEADRDHVLHFVSSGLPLPGHQIRVVDPAGRELPERREGRLEFRGPSSTSGYYRKAQKTRELFDGEWLDSGDLAYIAEGELYVTGRVKDIIIRAGRNIYPDELEKAVGDIPGIRKGCVAIFGAADAREGTERLVILAETRSTDPAGQEALRRRVNALAADLVGTPPDDVVLAPPGSVLKTSSGKIRRSASRQMYERGEIGKKGRAVWRQVAALLLQSALPQLRRGMNRAAAFLFALYGWSLFALLASVAWAGTLLLPGHRLRWRAAGACARLLARATRTPLKVTGTEHLERVAGSCVMVVNHASYLDSFVMIAALEEPMGFVAKAELAGSWMTRLPLRGLRTVFVERFDTLKSVDDVHRLQRLLEKSERLIFFPEGTFTRVPGLRPFHLGAFRSAADAGVPVIPVAIRGTRSVLRADSWFPRHGAITVTVGEPIDPAGLSVETEADSWSLALALRERARGFILRHCGEPDLERY
jgi:acyl carrier protein